MDRSLLATGASPVTSGLASAVLGLGETFQLEVVAEGIEFPEQWTTLRDLGCELGQGFYFARPMDARRDARASVPEWRCAAAERGGPPGPPSSPAPMHHSHEGLDRGGAATAA